MTSTTIKTILTRFICLTILLIFSVATLPPALVRAAEEKTGLCSNETSDKAKRSCLYKNGIVMTQTTCSLLDAANKKSGDQSLQKALDKLAKENDGKTAISVKSIDGKVVASVNGGDQMATRSAYKIYVAYAILKAVAEEKLTWESVSSDFNKMIIQSDNSSADNLRLRAEVGGPDGITKLLQDEVKLSSKTVMGTGNPTPPIVNTNSKSTSDDFVKFLTLLEKNKLPGLDAGKDSVQYDRLLDAMENQSAREQGIKAGVKPTKVADKPGWGPAPGAATNDVGIVYGKNEYAIAILTDYGNENWGYVEKIAKEVDAIVNSDSSAPESTTSDSEDAAPSESTDKSDGKETNAKKVYSFLIKNGLSSNAAAGIVGNLMQETSGGTENLDPNKDSGTHYGIAQWDKTDRYLSLVKFARDTTKTKVNDIDTQQKWLWEELTTSYKNTYEKIKAAKSVKEAAVIFLEEYEISGEKPGSPGYENRMKYAQQIKDKYGDGSDSPEAEAQNSCACEAGGAGSGGTDGKITSKPDGTIKGFVDAYGNAAFAVGKKYGIPYEAILAQAGIESGWGKSGLTSRDNNFFGIKAGPNWKGKTAKWLTHEADPPRTIMDDFRVYDSPEASFTGYASFIHHNSNYKEALKYPGDPVQYITEVKKGGYATDPQYITTNVSVQNTIIDYIKSKNMFPPSSEVKHSKQIPPKENETGGGGVTSADSDTGDGCETTAGQGGAEDVVRVAEEQYEKNKGITEYGGSIKDYTLGREEYWCADFVSWVYKEAGSPFTDGAYGDDKDGKWQYPGVVKLKEWFEAKHTYFKPGEQKPQPGDVAFYIGDLTPDGGSTEHVNIVIKVDGDTMTTIGGNESDQVKKGTRQVKLGSNSLAGFGRLK